MPLAEGLMAAHERAPPVAAPSRDPGDLNEPASLSAEAEHVSPFAFLAACHPAAALQYPALAESAQASTSCRRAIIHL